MKCNLRWQICTCVFPKFAAQCNFQHHCFTTDIIVLSFLPALTTHFVIWIALGQRDKNRSAPLSATLAFETGVLYDYFPIFIPQLCKKIANGKPTLGWGKAAGPLCRGRPSVHPCGTEAPIEAQTKKQKTKKPTWGDWSAWWATPLYQCWQRSPERTSPAPHTFWTQLSGNTETTHRFTNQTGIIAITIRSKKQRK
jgi:hypothetical protein